MNMRLVSMMVTVIFLGGCATSPSSPPPHPPVISASSALANLPPSAVEQAVPLDRNGEVPDISPAPALRLQPKTAKARPSHPIFFKHSLSLPIEGDLKQNWMAAHFINVGQGEAILLEFDCGAALIDTGGETRAGFASNEALKVALTAFFKRRADLDNTLDLLLLSHPHIDHTRGVDTVLKLVKVKHIVDDGLTHGSGIKQQQKAEQWAKLNHIPYEAIDVGMITSATGYTSATVDPISCSTVDPEIRVLWGNAEAYGLPENENDHSVVVRLDYGKSSFLFTGDLEAEGIDELLQLAPTVLDVDVLKVGHHGSKNGITPELMKATTPRMAAISVGDSTASQAPWTAFVYGHPNKVAIDLLTDPKIGISEERTPITEPVGIKGGPNAEFEPETIGSAIYATGWDGAFSVYASASGRLAVRLPTQ